MNRSTLASGIAALALVVGALSWSQPDSDSSDLWWHLASGRQTWQDGAIPRVDAFSHTAHGQPWINHEWLWGWLAWPAYQWSPDLVAWGNLAFIAATFALVGVASRRECGSWLAAGAATWLAAATSHWFLDVRPNLVTLGFTALLVATRDWRHAPWLWPPLLMLWANLHGGFVFGLGLLGLHLGVESGRALFRKDAQALPRAGWLGFAAAALAAGLNPWGFAIYGVPLQTLDPATPFGALIEWAPPEFGLDPRQYSGRFFWLALVTASGLWTARRSPFLVSLALVTAVMACQARRFVPLFAVASAPTAAAGLHLAWRAVRRRVPALASPGARLAGACVALVVALALWQNVRLLPQPLHRWTSEELQPSGAAAYLSALPEPPRRLFHFYNWGGYLALNAPRAPIFIDGRAGTVYADEIARDYRTLLEVGPGWRERLAAYGIDAVLLPVGSPLLRALRRESPPWRAIYGDPRSMLMFPSDAAIPLPAPASVLPEGANLRLSQAFRARAHGNLRVAESALVDAVRRDPLLLDAYAELMVLAARRGDREGVQRWIDAALEALPRRRNQIWASAEHAWLLFGDPQARLAALLRVRLDGPFIPESQRRETRERLRAAREHAARTR